MSIYLVKGRYFIEITEEIGCVRIDSCLFGENTIFHQAREGNENVLSISASSFVPNKKSKSTEIFLLLNYKIEFSLDSWLFTFDFFRLF